jgi:hypothetical protein
MSIRLTEGQLSDLGFRIDPGAPTRAIPVAPQSESLPDDSWDLERLARYAKTGLDEANRLDREAMVIGRRSTVEIFRVGRALSIARRKVKTEKWGDWGRWLTEHEIKRTTAWEAVELFERAGSEEAIANLTASQAKKKYGITRPRRRDPQPCTESTRPPGSSTSSAAIPGGESEDELGDDAEPDNPGPEPDLLVRPPRTVRQVLIAVSNLLQSCEERVDEMDATCDEILDEIGASAQRLKCRDDNAKNENIHHEAVAGMRGLPDNSIDFFVNGQVYDDNRDCDQGRD